MGLTGEPMERILKGASPFWKGETTEDTLSPSFSSFESRKCKNPCRVASFNFMPSPFILNFANLTIGHTIQD